MSTCLIDLPLSLPKCSETHRNPTSNITLHLCCSLSEQTLFPDDRIAVLVLHNMPVTQIYGVHRLRDFAGLLRPSELIFTKSPKFEMRCPNKVIAVLSCGALFVCGEIGCARGWFLTRFLLFALCCWHASYH